MKRITFFVTLLIMIIIGVFISCDSDSGTIPSGGGSTGTSGIVIIYDTSRANAQKFKDLLIEAGYNDESIELMSFFQLESELTNLSRYGLIIINPEAYLLSADTNRLKKIKSSNRPILGISGAGARLFDSLRLNIGWGNCAVITNELRLGVVDSSYTIWKTPYNLGVKSGDSIDIYKSNVYSCAVYKRSGIDTIVTLIGQSKRSPNYYHIALEKKYLLWGFSGSTTFTNGNPDLLTNEGKKLFINAVALMLTK